MSKAKVCVVEDESDVRESLTILLNGAPGFRCCGAHANAKLALRHLPRERPDILLVDLELPQVSGVDFIREAKEAFPKARIVVHSKHASPEWVFETMRAGADAYLHKEQTSYPDLVEALAEVREGGAPMSPSVARLVLKYFREQGKADDKLGVLTDREFEVLRTMAEGGSSNKEIAQCLGMKLDTVRSHVRAILDKLHARSRTEAVGIYYRSHYPGDPSSSKRTRQKPRRH